MYYIMKNVFVKLKQTAAQYYNVQYLPMQLYVRLFVHFEG